MNRFKPMEVVLRTLVAGIVLWRCGVSFADSVAQVSPSPSQTIPAQTPMISPSVSTEAPKSTAVAPVNKARATVGRRRKPVGKPESALSPSAQFFKGQSKKSAKAPSRPIREFREDGEVVTPFGH